MSAAFDLEDGKSSIRSSAGKDITHKDHVMYAIYEGSVINS